ncbi:hypothetical protein VD0002_g10153 [Verticillium dahliae]|uniref:Uncharacterized protein n=1 Tax=Verticillium dahliae TaxID=27337 RepID=A0AA45AHB6_VERDA|nr:hypothetical protein BJF96_g9750 [Verticillium dahliae]PNH39608.1 hypothetical protein VD0003_g10180 [Verticillium dahliae]PNH52654.1 hypothetical protein VD0002_g10153 [Verticillium dahliae]
MATEHLEPGSLYPLVFGLSPHSSSQQLDGATAKRRMLVPFHGREEIVLKKSGAAQDSLDSRGSSSESTGRMTRFACWRGGIFLHHQLACV